MIIRCVPLTVKLSSTDHTLTGGSYAGRRDDLVCHVPSRLNSQINANKGTTSAVLCRSCGGSDLRPKRKATVKKRYRPLQRLPRR
jgi:hypothetical protein